MRVFPRWFAAFLILGALPALVAGCSNRQAENGNVIAERAGASSRVATAGENGSPVRPPARPQGVQPAPVRQGRSLASLPGNDVRVNVNHISGSQQETAMAADPDDPNVIVGVWQDFTTAYHGWTTDGGATWQSKVLQLPLTPGNDYFDPAIIAAGNGVFHVIAIGYSTGIRVGTSFDGGATFTQEALMLLGGDKPYLAHDPDSGNLYLTLGEAAFGDIGIYFSRSVDGGATFSVPAQLISAEESVGNAGIPAVGTNGEIYVVWGLGNDRIWFDRSLDAGLTWLADDIVVSPYVPPRFWIEGRFRNPVVPDIIVDRTNGPHRGRIYVVWSDGTEGDADIVLCHSDDQGSTWSAPIRVNDDAVGNGADQWFPHVVVDDLGEVHVTFLDRRDDPESQLYSMYVATSSDGGASFGPNVRISDGLYPADATEFAGDYAGTAVSADRRLHPLWPDGRSGELDVYTRSVDLADYDDDLVLNDGDLNGVYADNRCTAGQTAGCDDNCPGFPNPAQADGDGDQVGDACDNCPGLGNTDQFDRDRDGQGDACDPCPDAVVGSEIDPDQDGVLTCNDNCPQRSNPAQLDDDGDGRGNLCDVYPTEADNDGIADGADNCPGVFNPTQRDIDGDGIGDRCDTCPDDFDPGQEDFDDDGRGDVCDCNSGRNWGGADRPPREVLDLAATKLGVSTARWSWSPRLEATSFSVSRGLVAGLAGGDYGACLIESLITELDDPDVPSRGEAFFYIVQGDNRTCGIGPAAPRFPEAPRVNLNPAACQGSEVQTFGSEADGQAEGDHRPGL